MPRGASYGAESDAPPTQRSDDDGHLTPAEEAELSALKKERKKLKALSLGLQPGPAARYAELRLWKKEGKPPTPPDPEVALKAEASRLTCPPSVVFSTGSARSTADALGDEVTRMMYLRRAPRRAPAPHVPRRPVGDFRSPGPGSYSPRGASFGSPRLRVRGVVGPSRRSRSDEGFIDQAIRGASGPGPAYGAVLAGQAFGAAAGQGRFSATRSPRGRDVFGSVDHGGARSTPSSTKYDTREMRRVGSAAIAHGNGRSMGERHSEAVYLPGQESARAALDGPGPAHQTRVELPKIDREVHRRNAAAVLAKQSAARAQVLSAYAPPARAKPRPKRIPESLMRKRNFSRFEKGTAFAFEAGHGTSTQYSPSTTNRGASTSSGKFTGKGKFGRGPLRVNPAWSPRGVQYIGDSRNRADLHALLGPGPAPHRVARAPPVADYDRGPSFGSAPRPCLTAVYDR